MPVAIRDGHRQRTRPISSNVMETGKGRRNLRSQESRMYSTIVVPKLIDHLQTIVPEITLCLQGGCP